MNIVKAYTSRSKQITKTSGGTNSTGKLFVGSQSCYEKPTVIITFENDEYSVEIQIPKDICEEIGSKIIKYGKLLKDSCVPFPISRGVPHDWDGKL